MHRDQELALLCPSPSTFVPHLNFNKMNLNVLPDANLFPSQLQSTEWTLELWVEYSRNLSFFVNLEKIDHNYFKFLWTVKRDTYSKQHSDRWGMVV